MTNEQLLKVVKRELLVFLEGDFRNRWLESTAIKVYVRKTTRPRLGAPMPADILKGNCLDIASVDVAEHYRGRGLFSDFMKYAEEVNPYPLILLENVHNPILDLWAARHGWTYFTEDYSWYKLTGEE